MGVFYRGRHRKPTYTGRKAATIAAAGAVSFGIVQPAASAGPPAGWGPIITCESGGNPTALNAASSASGLLQFVNGTWRAYGGAEFAPTAAQASVAEQMMVAERAYAAEGLQPWAASRSCWAGRTAAAPRETARPATPTQPRRDPVVTSGRHRAPAPSQLQVPADVGAEAHVVVEGDTLSEIAAEHRVQGGWPALYARNHAVIGANPHLIFPGQRINL